MIDDHISYFSQLEFTIGVAHIRQLPSDSGKEVAFVGRSNAGKSSAINVIVANKRMARTSKTPGRTQQLNYFSLDDVRRMVDLPGYGFAKVRRQDQDLWNKLLQAFFQRQSLVGTVLIVDIRRLLTDYDRHFLDWIAVEQRPVHVLLTKADKLSRGAAKNAQQEFSELLQPWQQQIELSHQLFSSLSKSGVVEARQKLIHWYGLAD